MALPFCPINSSVSIRFVGVDALGDPNDFSASMDEKS